MPKIPTPLALATRILSRFADRWYPIPTHRRLDSRDVLLAESIQKAETRSPLDGFASIRSFGPVVPDISTSTYADVTITGQSLRGTTTSGSVVIGTGTHALTLTNVIPGRKPITFSMITGTSESIAVNFAAGTVIVTLDNSPASTADSITTLINAHASAKYLLNATSGGAGTVAATLPTVIAGTAECANPGDPLPYLYDAALLVGDFLISGVAVTGVGVTSWTDSEIVFDIKAGDMDGSATPLVAGVQYPVKIIVDGVQYHVGTMIAVA